MATFFAWLGCGLVALIGIGSALAALGYMRVGVNPKCPHCGRNRFED
jgi:hypothetical protein